jgi:signal transduction histidine kinase
MTVLLVVIAAVVVVTGALALYLIVTERRRHQQVEQENARLLADAKGREAERGQLSDQLISAEQDERRRLALYLHDTTVQSLSGIALMLDAALGSLENGRIDESRDVIAKALTRHRDAIRELRSLSFNLEPIVLRDQGVVPAVQALADQIGIANKLRIEVDVEAAERLAEKIQAALYQIIRESLNQAIRRGPPTRIDVRVIENGDGSIETVISDDAPGERRRRSFEAIEERARTLNGRLAIDPGGEGTTIRVVLPAYAGAPE